MRTSVDMKKAERDLVDEISVIKKKYLWLSLI